MNAKQTQENSPHEANQEIRRNAPKLLLTVKEVYLAWDKQVGEHTLYAWLETGKLKSIRMGRKYLIPASELTDFLTREAA
jgi:excisionase family DNA binding protein